MTAAPLASGAGDEGHRWSGWPGAFCLNCFVEDVTEICATSHEHAVLDPERGICIVPCAEQQGPCPAASVEPLSAPGEADVGGTV